MEHLKRLLASHPLIFFILGIAVILDLTGVLSTTMPGTSFALGSILVVAYFLGVSGVLRFVIARRPIHLALTMLIMVFLIPGWLAIYFSIQPNQDQYRPSMLFALCAVAAFKTLRFRDAPITVKDTSNEPHVKDETP